MTSNFHKRMNPASEQKQGQSDNVSMNWKRCFFNIIFGYSGKTSNFCRILSEAGGPAAVSDLGYIKDNIFRKKRRNLIPKTVSNCVAFSNFQHLTCRNDPFSLSFSGADVCGVYGVNRIVADLRQKVRSN